MHVNGSTESIVVVILGAESDGESYASIFRARQSQRVGIQRRLSCETSEMMESVQDFVERALRENPEDRLGNDFL